MKRLRPDGKLPGSTASGRSLPTRCSRLTALFSIALARGRREGPPNPGRSGQESPNTVMRAAGFKLEGPRVAWMLPVGYHRGSCSPAPLLGSDPDCQTHRSAIRRPWPRPLPGPAALESPTRWGGRREILRRLDRTQTALTHESAPSGPAGRRRTRAEPLLVGERVVSLILNPAELTLSRPGRGSWISCMNLTKEGTFGDSAAPF